MDAIKADKTIELSRQDLFKNMFKVTLLFTSLFPKFGFFYNRTGIQIDGYPGLPTDP